ncbi:uncharacterized protein [Nicotiana tomentosiformis]|uniref:uncharacterized protein n=1 Tax=Nicotiana tomentosiformis TaxID=4098 RepID=UPI00388C7F99
MMIKALIWNLRHVKTQQAFQRVINMQREFGFFVVALMEPFQNYRHIQRYRRRLNMEAVFAKLNRKIWLFFDAIVVWEIVMDTHQQVTIKLYHQDISQHIMCTFVYVKCSSLERLELWDSLYYLASDMELPWMVGGDFNVLLHEDEKIGGLPVHPPEYEDFAFCKLKRVKAALAKWSKNTYGDIFKQLAIREDIVRVKEMLFEEEPTKAGITWFTEGDRSTRFFYNYVNGKRQKLQLKRIQDNNGAWVENRKALAKADVEFYERQFTQEEDLADLSLLANVPAMVTGEQNLELVDILLWKK